ncbi:putative F-box protein At1g49610 [Rhodamnia argentea]|uniref:F-box protein At1g49610 n=1 Tax=Rhodamnia argentea TaxID=178133 RepID=A0ABM3HX29_9MYRT|nr:putative F-box protein At1g49610 [Rhodamnia argentea]
MAATSSVDRPNLTKRKRSPSPSQRSISPGDRISALPDDVIPIIFQSLPFEDVVKTSVLSKSWRSAWTTTTHLAFDEQFRDFFDFMSFVNSIRKRFTSPTVKRLHVTNLSYNEGVRSVLDSCLRFVKERHVEEICLSFCPFFLYWLPTSLFCSSSLVRLEVTSCRFSLDGTTVSWPRLKVLSVKNADLSDDVLKEILRGSPLLESLKLCGCSWLKNITIDATGLKELVLVGINYLSAQKIWAPHLLSLRVSGNLWPNSKFRLENVSSLVEAQLDLVFEADDTRILRDFVEELFEKLLGVRTITINGWCLQALYVLEMEEAPSLLSKCQNLILHAGVSQWDLPGIAYMLRSSQCLEKLDILLTGDGHLKLELDEQSEGYFDFDEEDFLWTRKGCFLKHLKRVEIAGLEAHSFGLKSLLALIGFILGNALALEKMTIKVDQRRRDRQECLQADVPSELLGVSQNILNYRRASRNAEVIII